MRTYTSEDSLLVSSKGVPTLLLFSNPFLILFGLLRGNTCGAFSRMRVCVLSLMLLLYLLWARRSSALRCPAECPVRATSDCAFWALFARFIAKKCGKSRLTAYLYPVCIYVTGQGESQFVILKLEITICDIMFISLLSKQPPGSNPSS